MPSLHGDEIETHLTNYEAAQARRDELAVAAHGQRPIDTSQIVPRARFLRRRDQAEAVVSRLAGHVVHFGLPASRRMDCLGVTAFLAEFEPCPSSLAPCPSASV